MSIAQAGIPQGLVYGRDLAIGDKISDSSKHELNNVL